MDRKYERLHYKVLKNCLHSFKFIHIYLKFSWGDSLGFVYSWLFDFLVLFLAFCYFPPSVIRFSAMFDLGLFHLLLLSPFSYSIFSYSTFGYFRRSTFNILRSVILPLVLSRSVFRYSVILRSVNRRSVEPIPWIKLWL
jgi:hypothetical protein